MRLNVSGGLIDERRLDVLGSSSELSPPLSSSDFANWPVLNDLAAVKVLGDPEYMNSILAPGLQVALT